MTALLRLHLNSRLALQTVSLAGFEEVTGQC